MNQGFGREKRLLDAKQFKAVFDSPDFRLSGRCILALARHNQSCYPRIGLVVGKKNSKLAVARNRIKRQFREYFRLHQTNLPCVDIVLITRRGVDQLTTSELRQELDKLFGRLLRQYQAASDPSAVQAGQKHA